MQNKKEDIFDWFENQVSSVQRKFASVEDNPVYFHDYDDYAEGEWIDLFPGCKAKFSERSPDRFIIDCKMIAGVTLPIHHHPDYSELFNIVVGQLTDLNSHTTIDRDSRSLFFAANISHTMRCDVDCHMIIECKRVIS